MSVLPLLGLELLLCLGILVATCVLAPMATTGLLESLAARGLTGGLDAASLLEETRSAALALALGGGFLVFGRLASLRRGAGSIATPLLLPAVMALLGLGFLLQLGYGDPRPGHLWPGPDFGRGVAFAGLVAGLLLALPWDPAELARRGRHLLLLVIGGVFGALLLFGSGPGASDVRINLGPFQPIEVAKLGFVLLVAVLLGTRASKIRFHRTRFGFLRVPPPRLLLPAFLVLLSLMGGLFIVGDLGPSLVLAFVFLFLFFVLTRSPGWLLGAGLLVAACLSVLRLHPELTGTSTLGLRLRMWADPWLNGLPNGDQAATSLWAIAAGGWAGQGLGHAPALPAGHTDLVAAHLAEVLGSGGVLAYTLLLCVVVLEGMRVAAWNRTPERSLIAAGLSALLLGQWIVIAGGTLGWIPLTGIVVPFLSHGKSSMTAFCVLVALLLRMAEGGRCRADTDELRQLRHGGREALFASLAALGALWLGFATRGGPLATATSLRGVVTTLADGTLTTRHDPRLLALAARLPRGEIRDRDGRVLAGKDTDGSRRYPLGAALGTLLGFSTGEILRPSWALEKVFDTRLRGYGEGAEAPAAWIAPDPATGRARLLFAVPSRAETSADRNRAENLAIGMGADPGGVRLLPLPHPNLSPFLPLLRAPLTERTRRFEAMAADLDARSIPLTLDARLQERTARILQAAARRGKAAAAVVLDVSSGEVLARAQAPDFDPSASGWRDALLAADPRFLGVYGPWPDKTGLRGVFQAGSVGKLYSGVVAAREGLAHRGRGCASRGVATFACTQRDAQGPLFTRPGWTRPVHDHPRDPMHGTLEITEALAVSCNVFFAQLGLSLGPEAFAAAWAEGLEMGWGKGLSAGAPGSRTLASTAFGQGSMALSVSQAARLVALLGDGGIYRRCPSTLELGAPCPAKTLVADEGAIETLLAGMRRVVDEGTARRLPALAGVRVFGKTGTADAVGLAEEAPFGIQPGDETAPPHSWFVALAEPASNDPCAARAPGRLAVAVVVARGGSGAGNAAPAALEILGAARELGWLGKEPR